MKKFFIVLSALAALMLCVVPAQALVGINDDVPGSDAIVPFICDISGSTGLNTLFVFTDVGGSWTGTATAPTGRLHYTVNTTRSVTVHDGNWRGSPRDVVSSDAFTLLAEMSTTAKAALAKDIDGDGTNDHYAGYMYVENMDTTGVALAQKETNNVVGQFYLVNLAAGKAAAANIPMKEYSTTLAATSGTPAIVNEPFRNEMVSKAGTDINMELWSANALLNAQRLQAGLPTAANATQFWMFPRIFIVEGGVNWMMYWLSANDAFASGVVHVNVYNADEVALSTNIPLDDEWHIYDAAIHLPAGLWTAYPHEGWIDMTWATSTAALRTLEAIGWVYQQATGSASESWTVMTPMWRDVD
jgi:hypothetical protein